MRNRIYDVLNHLYTTILFISFWGGLFPLIPFVVAIIIGGSVGERISVFLYEQYYPWIIAGASVAIIIGMITSYIGKKRDC